MIFLFHQRFAEDVADLRIPVNPQVGVPARRAGHPSIIRRAEAIRWIQAQMADYGLTREELEAAGCFDPPPPPLPPVCDRNAEGLTWDRQGESQDWLRQAVNAEPVGGVFRVR